VGSLLLRKYVDTDTRSVLILTLLCDRRGCGRVDAVAVPTDEERATSYRSGELPPDFVDARRILHSRGWQSGKPVRCPDHVTPSWKAPGRRRVR
jgi:hypothetical protein